MRTRGNRAERDQHLVKENVLLKSKIAFSLGSLESLNVLLKNEDPEMLKKNIAHIKSMVTKALESLK
jgi:hypothetical protein